MARKKDKNMSGACPVRKTSIGGQALMEGIMMRGPQMTAMAVRNTQGEIVVETSPTVSAKRPAICRLPIIRGVFGFVDSMILGYKSLMRSAEISGLEELEEEMAREKAEKKAAKRTAKTAARGKKSDTASPVAETVPESVQEPIVAESTLTEDVSVEDGTPVSDSEKVSAHATADTDTKGKKGSSPLMMLIMVIGVLLALVIMVGVFFLLPTWLYDEVLSRYVSWIDADNRYLQSVFEGVLRVTLLVGYMALISLMKDIRRTFQYHGAEHKTIFCYENGLELTVENVRKQRRFHPRCGTSFLILMMLVSILVGFFIPPTLTFWLRAGIKLLLFPVVMGLGYELIKLCGRYDNWLTRIISAPGVALQHITVFEPDDSMIECAIAAMNEVIPKDESDKW